MFTFYETIMEIILAWSHKNELGLIAGSFSLRYL